MQAMASNSENIVSDLVANIYASGHELSKTTGEFMRKARNAEKDSVSRMTKSQLYALRTMLHQTLDCMTEEANLLLTALLGYEPSESKLPGQLVHGYLIKPLRDHDDKAIEALEQLLEIIREIQGEWIADNAIEF